MQAIMRSFMLSQSQKLLPSSQKISAHPLWKKTVKLKNDGKQWRDKRLLNNNQTPARARDELKLLSYFQSRVFFFLKLAFVLIVF